MIAIKGIRIDGISIKRNEKGQHQVSSSYSLISAKDVVLAEQSVGYGYNEMKLEPSSETLKVLQEFATLYEKDITELLGLAAE